MEVEVDLISFRWSEHQDELYPDRKEVRHGGHLYRAYASPGVPGVAAVPGDLEHLRFSVTRNIILRDIFIKYGGF